MSSSLNLLYLRLVTKFDFSDMSPLLRWWVPWMVQAVFARVARLMGLTHMIEKYTSKEDWEAITQGKQL